MTNIELCLNAIKVIFTDKGVISVCATVVGVLIGFALSQWVAYKTRKRKLKAHWSAIQEEVDICKERGEEFINVNITAPLYRLPLQSYKTSIPIILQEGDVTSQQVKSLIKYFQQAHHFNRGLDIAEKLFVNGGNFNNINNRNKLYAKKLCPGNGGELYSEVASVLEVKVTNER